MESQEKGQTETKIVKAASIVAVATFLSRILGFLRDMAFAAVFGATMTADAFYVAFRIPNLLRELLAEGSMSAAFIPVFTEYHTQKTHDETRAFVRSVFTILCLGIVLIVGGGILFAPQIVSLIAPGFLKHPDQFQLATALTRIMFPFLLFISFAALTMGILNSTNHFGPPAISSALFNVAMILFILFPFVGAEPVFSAAMGVVVGGVIEWVIQIPAVRKEGFSLSFRWPIVPFHPGVKKMAILLLPVTLSLSVTQINILVSTLVASKLAEGTVTFLYYGMRLIHFPLGIFGVALATALLPTLSAHAAHNDLDRLRQGFSFGLRLIFFITLPAMVGLICLRVPIVHLLFERGAFSSLATQGVAQAILYYTVGLWAFAGVRVIVPVFYALQDTKTPVSVAIFAMFLNIVLVFTLSIPLQHRGLALATSLSAICNFLILVFLLRKKIGRIDAKRILYSHIKVVLASLCMVPLVVWIAHLSIWNGPGQMITKFLYLTGAILFSCILYFFAQTLLKSEELQFMKGLIKNRLASAKR